MTSSGRIEWRNDNLNPWQRRFINDTFVMLVWEKARIIVQLHAVRMSLPTLSRGAVIFRIALCWSGGPLAAVIIIAMITITRGVLTTWSLFLRILSGRVSMGHLNIIKVKLFLSIGEHRAPIQGIEKPRLIKYWVKPESNWLKEDKWMYPYQKMMKDEELHNNPWWFCYTILNWCPHARNCPPVCSDKGFMYVL